ncbi:MAG: hypothetical protein ACOC1X_04005 [Promethearchaeota archaeon]
MKSIIKWFTKKQTDRSSKQINQSKVKAILEEQLPTHNLLSLDVTYFVPEHDQFKKILHKTEVDEIEWVKDKFDCENHSFYLHSLLALNYDINSCGIVISYASEHAFNIILTHKNGNISTYILEPQEDKLWKPGNQPKDRYIIKDQIILI